jgi:glycosyltransferase involved in cell wall biosynthesis
VILHQHFNTPLKGGPLRSYYLAKALLDHGHDVAVITSGKSAQYEVQNVDGIEVHHLAIPYDNRFGFYARITSFLKFAVQSYRVASKIPDVKLCYAMSVPLTVGIPALWLKWFRNIPFLFEVGDLWPDAPIQLGFIKNPLLKQFLFTLEKRIYREARSIVALSEPIKARIEKKVPGVHVGVVPNMADTEFYQPASIDPTAQDPFVVSYIGALGFANGLDHLIECARACQKAELPVKFVVCGDGAFQKSLMGVAERLQIKNLTFLKFQNRNGVQELLNNTHAAFISYRPFPILETGSPNKYFDGLAAGKLIVLNFSGWIKDEVEQHACGVYLDPRFPHEIVKVITPFVFDRKLLERYQLNARNLAERKYNRDMLGKKFVEIIETQ